MPFTAIYAEHFAGERLKSMAHQTTNSLHCVIMQSLASRLKIRWAKLSRFEWRIDGANGFAL